MSWISDQDAPHFNIPDEFEFVDQKATPVDADRVLLEDSADGFAKKYAEVGDLPGGGGGSVDVEDDDVFVAAADTLNFGSNLTVTDDGGGKVTVGATGGGNAAYAETIGDNTNTTYTVTHNLGTTDLVVQLWDLTGTDPVEATGDASSIDAVSVNAIEVTFAAAPPVDSYRVVILADGGGGGGDSSDPLGIGAPITPAMLQWGGLASIGTNQGRWFRVIGSGTIDAIGIQIGTSSGNISVAVYRKTGIGRDARPGVRLATTGSIASPGTGYQEIALGSSVAVENGDFFFVSASNSTVTFRCNATAAAGVGGLGLGFTMFATSAHPAPGDNPTVTDGLNGFTIAMVGIPV